MHSPTEVPASPSSRRSALTSRGVAILLNEMKWVWAPSVGLAAVVLTLRAWLRPPPRRAVAKPRPASQPRPAPPVPPSPARRAPAPPPPPPRPAPPPPRTPIPLAPLEPLERLEAVEPPSPAPPPPAPPPSGLPPARRAAPLLHQTLASLRRHRGHVVLVGAVVLVVGVGVFVARQQAPPPPVVVEEPAAEVAPPPKPLQADAEGYYEPGYQFSVNDQRFTRLTLRPEPSVRFARTGTRTEFGCFDAVITAQVVRMTCEIERVGTMTIDGRFVNRVATTHLDAPAISAVLTLKNARGEVLYSARDNFVWRPPE